MRYISVTLEVGAIMLTSMKLGNDNYIYIKGLSLLRARAWDAEGLSSGQHHGPFVETRSYHVCVCVLADLINDLPQIAMVIWLGV
jgi:hypothetical protein